MCGSLIVNNVFNTVLNPYCLHRGHIHHYGKKLPSVRETWWNANKRGSLIFYPQLDHQILPTASFVPPLCSQSRLQPPSSSTLSLCLQDSSSWRKAVVSCVLVLAGVCFLVLSPFCFFFSLLLSHCSLIHHSQNLCIFGIHLCTETIRKTFIAEYCCAACAPMSFLN